MMLSRFACITFKCLEDELLSNNVIERPNTTVKHQNSCVWSTLWAEYGKSSGSSYLDLPNKRWSHSFLKVIYWSVWVQDLNYLLKLQKTILVCHKKGEDKKKKALSWHSNWYLIKVSVKHFAIERFLTCHLLTCYMYDDCYDSFPEVSADRGDVEKAELIQRNNKKTPVTD